MKIKNIKGIMGALTLFCGLFLCSFSANAQVTPGGIDMTGRELNLWVDGDHSTNSSWSNIPTVTPATHELVKFSTNAPTTRNSRFNFHKELYFGNATSSKLHTSTSYNLQRGDSYYIFVVSDASSANTGVLFTFNAGAGNTSLRWNASATNILSSYWTTTQRSPNFAAANHPRYGITTMNIVNSHSNALDMYLNGEKASFTLGTGNNGTGAALYNVPLLVGNTSTSTGTGSGTPFNGAIQEIILIKKSSANELMSATDLAKIHSYLSIKYGISLNYAGQSNLYNSAGNVVWDGTANAGYRENVFGLGRDNASGLYQKQSFSSAVEGLTAFIGSSKTELNELSDGTLANGQYIIFGASSKTVLSPDNILAGTLYEGGEIDPTGSSMNVTSPTYLAQLTNAPALPVSVKFSLTRDMAVFSYALVSVAPTFLTGGTSNTTKIFPVVNGEVTVQIDASYKYIRFVGISPGPGGVTANLRLWLRADDDNSLKIENLDKTDYKVNNFPDMSNFSGSTLPAVTEWRDDIRGHNYSYAAGSNATSASDTHKAPIHIANSPEMNYHPAVRFYSRFTGSPNFTSYLSNPTGVMAANKPTDGKHTAYFVVNNDFGRNAWFYQMGFRSNSPVYGSIDLNTDIPEPAYGAERGTVSGSERIFGRFRTDSQVRGTVDMFNIGATSILGYYSNASGSNGDIHFRFSGREDIGSPTYSWSGVSFTQPSTIGSSYYYNRTMEGVMSEAIIYEDILNLDDQNALESYLSIKYGITLRPENTSTKRFDYKFSDDRIFWKGDSAATSPYSIFYNNVTAVIRDDAADLYNKHAHSTDAGSLVHMGIAGSKLSAGGEEVGDIVYDREAVAWGSNGGTGITTVPPAALSCGEFDYYFNRQWLVHKVTHNDEPIQMLVGAQDNSTLTLGKDDPNAQVFYNYLTPAFDVVMLVAKSAADFATLTYTAVVPMSYINGEHQCIYTFKDTDTYITFGVKPNGRGCIGNSEYFDNKQFDWKQYTSSTNTASNSTSPLTITMGPKDLLDGIQVVGTTVTYPSPVRSYRGYPRSVGTPKAGSLEIRRSRGSATQPVTVTVEFNTPVRAEFAISGLSGRRNNFEKIEVRGECPASTNIYPTLSYAGDSKKANYQISGNTATVRKRATANASAVNGTLNVNFQGGVQKIIIEYTRGPLIPSTRENIYITPINVRPIPPPPPINEDGLSFTKMVDYHNITTCEHVKYTFEIGNVNCDPQYVSIDDVLPPDMIWDKETLAVGPLNDLNPSLYYNDYGDSDILHIDSLLVPGASKLQFSIMASLVKDAPTGDYLNQAQMSYSILENSIPTPKLLLSVDAETLDANTAFNATYAERKEEVTVKVETSYAKYRADSKIDVTYTITNPNDPIPDMFLDVDYNEEFKFINTTFTKPAGLTAYIIEPDPLDPEPSFSVAGSTNGETGFILPTGETVLKFSYLLAPDHDNLVEEVDGLGNLTGDIIDLVIEYKFHTDLDDPCLIRSIEGLAGEKVVPYSKISHIKTNKNITVTTKQQ
ncbi:MAG: hypothetical protein LBN74_08625 [Prevotella sp.]|jgi:hypothetical protein|nr:hypothetical protein [Prevotella sp.]